MSLYGPIGGGGLNHATPTAYQQQQANRRGHHSGPAAGATMPGAAGSAARNYGIGGGASTPASGGGRGGRGVTFDPYRGGSGGASGQGGQAGPSFGGMAGPSFGGMMMGQRSGTNPFADLFAQAGKSPGFLGPPPSISSNTAAPQPDIGYGIDRLRDLYETDMGAGRSIDRLGRQIRDFGAGQGQAAAARRTARGVSGTGVDDYDEANIREQGMRAFAGGAADIEEGANQRRQSVLRDIIGGGSAQAGAQQGGQGMALTQANLASRQWEQMQLAQERARDRQLQMAMQALSMFGGGGGFF